eukprot:TRINITY_DN147_c1_g1_i1.p1 TRINITY_DN147_c1_g1~~TRINITY_DN147_c1_g1_i1.p1  ORF type:complete len:309 (+),score=83.15 TRINITY_DN147_c1_g1_i1:57-983(+)
MSSFGYEIPIFSWHNHQELNHVYDSNRYEASIYEIDNPPFNFNFNLTPSEPVFPEEFSLSVSDQRDDCMEYHPMAIDSVQESEDDEMEPQTTRPIVTAYNINIAQNMDQNIPLSRYEEQDLSVEESTAEQDQIMEDEDAQYSKSDKREDTEDQNDIEDEDDEEDQMDDRDELEEAEQVQQAEEELKLQASKSPIMDALVYCALKKWGIELVRCEGEDIQFRLLNFQEYYEKSAQICSKQHPTEDEGSRIKALKRWFPDFPTKRERGRSETPFIITVQKGKKENKPKKIREIIEKTRRLLGMNKVRSLR